MYSPAFPAAAVDVDADMGTGGDNKLGTVAAINEGETCRGDRVDDRTNSTRQRGETRATGSQESNTKNRRGREQRPLAVFDDGKLAANRAANGDERVGDVSEKCGAAARQLPKVSNESNKRGKRRSRSRRRRAESTAHAGDNGGVRGGGGGGGEGTKEGRETVQALSTPGSPRHDDGGGTSSLSSPRSGRDNQRERGVSPASRPGSPRRGRRHRRGREAKRRDRGDGSTNNDGRVERQAGVNVAVASKAGEKKEAVGDGDGGDAGDGRCDNDDSLAEEGVLAGVGVGPDPAEAGHMLQALAGLSTTLRRLSRAEENTATPANPDPVRTAAAGSEGGRGDVPPACERCVVLSESLESLLERARAQERLLEHSEKLLTVATTTAAPFDTRVRPTGQRDESCPTADAGSSVPIPIGPGASADPAGPIGAAVDVAPVGQVKPVIRPTGNEDVPRDEQPPEGRGHHASTAGAGDAGAGDERVGAGGADEENEELLAAAEEVWRVSEMARNALQGELERKDEALSAAAKTARESKEELSKQVWRLLFHVGLGLCEKVT